MEEKNKIYARRDLLTVEDGMKLKVKYISEDFELFAFALFFGTLYFFSIFPFLLCKSVNILWLHMFLLGFPLFFLFVLDFSSYCDKVLWAILWSS